MPEQTEHILFIGGPLDGERPLIPIGKQIWVIPRPKKSLTTSELAYPGPGILTETYYRDVLTAFEKPGKSDSYMHQEFFFRHESFTHVDVVIRLMERYPQDHNGEH